MKPMIMFGIISMVFSLNAESKPKADVYVRVTDELPKLWTGTTPLYNGILSVTNTGEQAFIVFTDDTYLGDTIRFYQEGNEDQQRVEDALGRTKQRREEDRQEVSGDYYYYLEKKESTKILQPGENITLKCKFYFRLPFSSPGGIYKGEMYLGDDTWVPVHITPTPSVLVPLEYDRGKPVGDFYYAKEGTNKWLYVKTDDGTFKRVREMKLGAKPQKEKEENAVTFEALDGTREKLTSEQARQIIHDAGN